MSTFFWLILIALLVMFSAYVADAILKIRADVAAMRAHCGGATPHPVR